MPDSLTASPHEAAVDLGFAQPPPQFYETTVHDRETPRALSFVTVPRRSIRFSGELLPYGSAVPNDFRMKDGSLWRPVEVVNRHPEMGAIADVLPAVVDALLESYAYAAKTPGGRVSEIQSRMERITHTVAAFHGGLEDGYEVSSFARYLSSAPVIPFESSPLAPKSLSDLAAAGTGTAGAVGAYATGEPLLLLTIPAGIILCGAARGVSRALEVGFRVKLLALMGVEDPDRRPDALPPAADD